MSQFKLVSEIVKLSDSDTWEQAKYEWNLQEVYFSDVPETCLCGHNPIIELCELRNRNNNNTAIVGNCCVKKFIGLPSDKIFQAVKRIKKDGDKSLNKEAIDHAQSKGWINDWEYKFYSDTFSKRKLSDKQRIKRNQINERILFKMNKKD
jgi:hypothetical protein